MPKQPSKPPPTPPHSDLDGVHEDGFRPPDAARAAGQDAGDLDRARKQAAARPARAEEESLDDRSG